MAVRSLSEDAQKGILKPPSAGSPALDSYRAAIAKGEEESQRNKELAQEYSGMFRNDSADTSALASAYSRNRSNSNLIEVLEAIFQPVTTKEFPKNKRYRALLFKAEGLLNRLESKRKANETLNALELDLMKFLNDSIDENGKVVSGAISRARTLADRFTNDTSLI